MTLLETGQNTMTGGGLKRVMAFIEDEDFLIASGDGLTSSNINDLIAFHKAQKKTVTLAAVRPSARFGDLTIRSDTVVAFKEKADNQRGYVNVGDYLTDDQCALEQEPLNRLAAESQLAAFIHPGFWQCKDTYRERRHLTHLWNTGRAPRKLWQNV